MGNIRMFQIRKVFTGYLEVFSFVRITIFLAPSIHMVFEVEFVHDHVHVSHFFCCVCEGASGGILCKFFKMAGVIITNGICDKRNIRE